MTSKFFLIVLLHYFIALALSEWKGIDNACLCQEFRCSNSNGTVFCLHKSKVCSGFNDCLDGEDENKEKCSIGKSSQKQICKKDEFKCKFGGCIKFNQVCDLNIDCWGGVDEAKDFCDWINSKDK